MRKFARILGLALFCACFGGAVLAKTFVIDVRTPAEFAAGHLDGALNIEYQYIGGQIGMSGAGKKDEIILYCHSGRRAGIAQKTLTDLGFKKVQNYGGMEEARKRLQAR